MFGKDELEGNKKAGYRLQVPARISSSLSQSMRSIGSSIGQIATMRAQADSIYDLPNSDARRYYAVHQTRTLHRVSRSSRVVNDDSQTLVQVVIPDSLTLASESR
jgi:hypothetical protein